MNLAILICSKIYIFESFSIHNLEILMFHIHKIRRFTLFLPLLAFIRKKAYLIITACLVLLFVLWLLKPVHLFNAPYSLVLEDVHGRIAGAKIAGDGQWRFPPVDSLPEKYIRAVTCFEDKRFFYHPGVDPLAIIRALYQNITAGETVSGASTLTMQTVRLSRKGRERTVFEKIIEMFLAFQLECRYSKHELLRLYASHAPFGGNVVGLRAASLRYFGRNFHHLTWAETAMLAVLPNSPSLIHPGRNRERLFSKRNSLLKKLVDKQIITPQTYELAISEPLPDKPLPFDQIAPHLLQYTAKNKPGTSSVIKTTIDAELQKRVCQIAERHHDILSGNGVNNIAALVMETESGHVRAYVGNLHQFGDKKHGYHVDIIQSPRSTGSILKPFLYAAMLSSGELLPNALVPDIPTRFDGFRPENYHLGYSGAVPAKRALARSLNIPAVRLLNRYGVERFHYVLNKSGITSVRRSPDHYGLSLILGGCEASLWEICGVYASMARRLLHYNQHNQEYLTDDFFQPVVYQQKTNRKNIDSSTFPKNQPFFMAGAIWHTFQALIDVERPEGEQNWQEFTSSSRIAWKTGTSFGFRDAWAIGVSPAFVVGVWAGNADGEGRPGLVGVKAAAPVLFDIFNALNMDGGWFSIPHDDLAETPVCVKSGYLASPNCPRTDTLLIPEKGVNFRVCPFHKMIHLDSTANWQVDGLCEQVTNMKHRPWFVLPPAMEWYYRQNNPEYIVLPPFREDCTGQGTSEQAIQMIYPFDDSQIYIPVDLDGDKGRAVFEAAHREQMTTIYWHMDSEYLGYTKDIHQFAVNPSPGNHILRLVDEHGEELTIDFEIIQKKN